MTTDPPSEALARGERYRQIQDELKTLRVQIKADVLDAVQNRGVEEAVAARVFGVDRMTVRSWLGKR